MRAAKPKRSGSQRDSAADSRERPIPRIAVLGDLTAAPVLVTRIISESQYWWARPADACWESIRSSPAQPMAEFDAALLIDRATADDDEGYCDETQARVLERLAERHIPVLVLTRRPSAFAPFAGPIACLSPGDGFEAIRGALRTLAALRPAIDRLGEELSQVRFLGRRLEGHYRHLNQDLQLASRLQQDFLPRSLPDIGRVRFTTFFRPCTQVSGDIFDIVRLDETHVGFYLADAVGHGVAAGLLTMYIKHAIRPKRIRSDGYELVPPGEVLAELNDHLVAQSLPESQFVTAWYGRVNVETMQLDFGVAGHPPALLVEPDGSISELRGDGCLLGVFAAQPFTDFSIQLQPGQRLCVYSDGLEATLIDDRLPSPSLPIFREGVAEMLRLPAVELLSTLQERLDTTPGGLTHADDVSMVIVDALDQADTQSSARPRIDTTDSNRVI